MTDQLAEALELYGPIIDQKDLSPIVGAARKWSRLTVPCETCGGKGFAYESDLWMTPDDYPDNATTLCPTCDGDGWRVNPEAVEVLARSLWKQNDMYPEWDNAHAGAQDKNTMMTLAEAGLRAVIEWAGRKEDED